MYGSDRFLSDKVPGDRDRARFLFHTPHPGVQLRKHFPDAKLTQEKSDDKSKPVQFRVNGELKALLMPMNYDSPLVPAGEKYATRTPWTDRTAKATIHTGYNKMRNHPYYDAAKRGDSKAAAGLVMDLMNPAHLPVRDGQEISYTIEIRNEGMHLLPGAWLALEGYGALRLLDERLMLGDLPAGETRSATFRGVADLSRSEAGAALAPHGVDLIDKYDARAIALRLVEQVAHAAGAHAHKHLDELGAGDAEEGHARLARDGLGHERLACARGAYQQHALGNACAQCGEFLRLLEEFDDLLQLLFGLVGAGNIAKGYGWLVSCEDARLALAKGQRLIVRPL